MAEQMQQTFNHFSLISFTDAYWLQPPEERRRIHSAWIAAIGGGTDVVHLYQSYAVEAASDLLVWCASVGDNGEIPGRFFTTFAQATAQVRSYVKLRTTLWGFTRPSQYTKTRSTQEVDPFSSERLPYLVMYPFVKTPEWYLKSQDERQRMMSQHIKVGKQYKDIRQLLLYSFGLQDQEYVVVYETLDLVRFLNLVNELRATEARLFTERDSPVHTAVHQPHVEALAAWL